MIRDRRRSLAGGLWGRHADPGNLRSCCLIAAPVNGPLFSNILNDVTGLVVVASEDDARCRGRWSSGLAGGAWLWRLLQHLVVLNAIRKPGLVDCGAKTSSGSAFRISFRIPYIYIWPQVWRSISRLSQAKDLTLMLDFGRRQLQHYPASQYGPVARQLENLDERCVRSDDGLVRDRVGGHFPDCAPARRHRYLDSLVEE